MRRLSFAFAFLVGVMMIGTPPTAQAARIGVGITLNEPNVATPVWHRGYPHEGRRWRREGRRCRVVVRRYYNEFGERRTVRRRVCRW